MNQIRPKWVEIDQMGRSGLQCYTNVAQNRPNGLKWTEIDQNDQSGPIELKWTELDQRVLK